MISSKGRFSKDAPNIIRLKHSSDDDDEHECSANLCSDTSDEEFSDNEDEFEGYQFGYLYGSILAAKSVFKSLQNNMKSEVCASKSLLVKGSV
eukprot:CAMPEP_0171454996 /NCGR_PEP_ID=MMETSP0945-20130129/2065_1 /TAXON_ID=109269 /ORGANISM="Vaucheria litorea, Strain CCMP2940" /LENGTH=92 /DNA_ID=CAMNT_0011980143 /DNA_START=432 /DNA_END=709 /DNA_ORIENTATION=+